MDNMSDLSFTQTSKAMRSTHMDRKQGNYIPWWVIVAEYNRKTPKKVIDRRAIGWKSQPNVFMGC